MRLYVVDSEGRVVAQRGTITQGQRNDDNYIVAAKDPPKDKADKETGAWREKEKVDASYIYDANTVLAISQLPKAHVLNLFAFGKKS